MVIGMEEKEKIRQKMLEQLKNMDKEEKERRNARIREKLFSYDRFKRASIVMSYVSKGYEVDTWEIIKRSLEMGKKVAVPFILKEGRLILPSLILDPKELIPGPFGVCQPHPDNLRQLNLNQIEIILVPGLAFDRQGNRLGHGQGYFDRFLKKIPPNIHTIGLAYEFQILNTLPFGPEDIPVSTLIYG